MENEGKKNSVANPILPLEVCIPDGEPHVIGDRIYLFGSHDISGGDRYCAAGDYQVWSAPLTDPADWNSHGVAYRAEQDPDYVEGETNDLYAPDVVQGKDGRFYLYYNIVTSNAANGFHRGVNVAVADRPEGPYEYYGYVRDYQGNPFHEYLMSDPAVINDDGVFRLYCGWSLSMVAAGAHKQGAGAAQQGAGATTGNQDRPQQMPAPYMMPEQALYPAYKMMFGREPEDLAKLEFPLMGANTMVLDDDMLTVKGQVSRIVEGQFATKPDSSFFGHAFYEASSIRKINGKYYFIYSSENSNELCYAISDAPDRGFVYGGTIISNGDVGYRGRKKEDRVNMTANNHGSLECIGDQWYIFYHRQTDRSTFSRQPCVEPVTIREDGSIEQVCVTSMGFRQVPFGMGTYPAGYACNLSNGHMPHCTNTRTDEDIPYLAAGEEAGQIKNISDGTYMSWKYFDLRDSEKIAILGGGDWKGSLQVFADETLIGEISVEPTEEEKEFACLLRKEADFAKVTLRLQFEGQGKGQIKTMALC